MADQETQSEELPGTPMLFESSGDTPQTAEAVPKVLCDMYAYRTKFAQVPKFTCSVKEENARLKKELSVCVL